METVTNHVNRSKFAPASDLISRTGYTAAQDADREDPVADLTIMAKDSAGKLIPLSDNTAVDGTQIPVGILRGSIPAADLVADDVSNVELYISGKYFNEADLTLENSLTLDSEIAVDCHNTLQAAIASPNATDLASAETLVNEIKGALNTARTAGVIATRSMTIREYLNTMGIFTRATDAATGYENS